MPWNARGKAAFGSTGWGEMTKAYDTIHTNLSNATGWKKYAGAGALLAGGIGASYGASYAPTGLGVAAGAALGYRMGGSRTDVGRAMRGPLRSGPLARGMGMARNRGMRMGFGTAGKIGGGIAGALAGGAAMGINRWLWD